MRLEELIAEEKRLEGNLAEVRAAIRAENERAAGVMTGELVIGGSRSHEGKVFRVHHLEMLGFKNSKPWVVGQRQRKDGTFTEATYNLYDNWQKVQP